MTYRGSAKFCCASLWSTTAAAASAASTATATATVTAIVAGEGRRCLAALPGSVLIWRLTLC